MTSSKSLFLDHYQEVLIPGCLLVMAGALTASSMAFPQMFWLGWTVITGLSLLACLLFSKQFHMLRWFLWLTCLFMGGFYASLHHFVPGPHDISQWADRSQALVTGVVTDLSATGDQWTVGVTQLDKTAVNGTVLVKWPYNTVPPQVPTIGQTVQVTGQLLLPRSAAFPGAFDYQRYLQQKHISALVKPRTILFLPGSQPGLWLQLLEQSRQCRNRITRNIENALPGPEGEIFASVFLGDQAVGIENDTKQSFIRAGLIHVLAASGMNVGFIAVFFLAIGTWLRFPFRLSLGLAMVGIAFYCLLTGLPPSVERAGLMLELALLLKAVRKELSALSLLCITGLLLTLWNPVIVAMVGFQLSFLSTYGLLSMVQPLQEKLGFYLTSWGAGLLLVPLVAQLWVSPILAYDFNQLQLMSLPANLIALPIVAILTYVGFGLGALSLVVPNITGFFIAKCGFLCFALHQVAQFFGNLPCAFWVLPSPALPTIILLMGLLFYVSWALHHRHLVSRRVLLMSLATVCLLLILPMSLQKWLQRQETVLSWIPNEDAPSTQVIQLPSGAVYVNLHSLSPGITRNVAEFLKKQGIQQIDALYLDASRLRLTEGLPLLATNLHIRQLLLPQGLAWQTIQTLVPLAEALRIPLMPLAPTHLLDSGMARVTYYSALPESALQRLDLPQFCFAKYRGRIPLSQSLLNPLTQSCDLVQSEDNNRQELLWWPSRSQTIFLKSFTQVRIKPGSVQELFQ